jgi:hypothetical protein
MPDVHPERASSGTGRRFRSFKILSEQICIVLLNLVPYLSLRIVG